MTNEAPPSGEVSQVVEHLFRHESGKMVATLMRIFGVEHLTLAEDVVQEALARALQTWPFYGVPQNPSARLVEFDDSPVVALNRAVAVANVGGPAAGLEAVVAIPSAGKLKDYYLYYAVRGEFESRLEHHEAAAGHFRKALELAELKSERAFLEGKLKACRPCRRTGSFPPDTRAVSMVYPQEPGNPPPCKSVPEGIPLAEI